MGNRKLVIAALLAVGLLAACRPNGDTTDATAPVSTTAASPSVHATPRPTQTSTPKPVHRAIHRSTPTLTPSSPTKTSSTTKTTTTTSNCDPNYAGACLRPDVSDYDCAGGSGDGPYYVQGPIRVVGVDHYHLDRDGDGV